MDALNQFAFFSLIFFGTLTIIGLVRPYLVLFWTENHDRRAVIQIFGTITLAFVIMYGVTASQGDGRDNGMGKNTATQQQ